ncbi:protein translocase subunit SecDF [Nosocomiicoccus ampullae]|uniref:protein translocase subunit SecDF n=1 Tax=Nosocomiicoccus ampullae TaxID=489910 RepID=UPI001C601438|nr:protein translocase subunit SecDF [Nosocomiicoccus ampullae]QYA49132.1 protein translocase subunit SecDF [Nosocomiicoccus ampullae]
MKKKPSRIISLALIVVLLGTVIGLTYKDVVKDVNLGLDLQGGFEVLYQVEPLEKDDKIDQKDVEATASTLDSRVNVLGVSEPNIQIEEGNRIRVQLAGVEDQKEARELLSTQAELTIRDVNDNVLLSGKDLVQGGASQGYDDLNQPIVSLKLKDANKFNEITKEVSEMPQGTNLLVIWMDFEEGVDSFEKEMQSDDPKYISAASVDQPINSTEVMISGGFSDNDGLQRAQNIAALLNSGALPVKLDEIFSTSVGAQFGEEALDKTVKAGAIGVIIVLLYMLVFYRVPGLIASLTLVVYVYLTLVMFNLISGVLTLPGIAALILGVGMAVDANIILYERVKEEIRIGRSIQEAYKKGASSSLWTIIDANLTTLIAAIILFIFGTSSVKGFATMLLLSILMSFVTAVFLTRVLMRLLVSSGWLDNKPGLFGLNQKHIHNIREGVNVQDLKTVWDRLNFAEHAKKFFLLSGVIILVGAIILSIFKLNLGIDFTSGTRADIVVENSTTEESVREDLTTLKLEPESLTKSGDNTIVARYSKDLNKDQIAELQQFFEEKYGKTPMTSTVSPVVGQELVKNAIKALLIASVAIIIYVSIRFEWRMGLPAVIALIHDVFIMIAVFSLFRLEIDITFIAAVLTIVGYSINDTIVTFDRIRENNKKMKMYRSEADINRLINTSLRQTMTRSLNTVLTVIIVVVFLVLMGSESIFTFSVALLVGLISGVYSSLFIAIQLWGVLKKKQLRKNGGTLVVYEEKRNNNDKVLV